jgi:hypothetical protein
MMENFDSTSGHYVHNIVQFSQKGKPPENAYILKGKRTHIDFDFGNFNKINIV